MSKVKSPKPPAKVYTCWRVGCGKVATRMFQGGDADPRSGHWCAKHFKEQQAEHQRIERLVHGKGK